MGGVKVAPPTRCPTDGATFPSVFDLDVAPGQGAGYWVPVRVGLSVNAERIRSPGLATVVDFNSEVLRGRACRLDDRGRATDRGVLAPRCRRARITGAADNWPLNGLCLYPYVCLMVVVFEVSCRRAALRHKAEGGLRVRIGQTGNQSRHGQESAEGREDGVVARDLTAAGHLPWSRDAADACPSWGARDEPRGVVDVWADLSASTGADRTRTVRIAPPVAGAIDRPAGEGRMNRDPVGRDGDVEIVLVDLSCREGWIVFEPDGDGILLSTHRVRGQIEQVADVVTHDKNVERVTLQSDSMCPATTSQGVDGVVRDHETGLARSIVDLNPVGSSAE